MSNSDSIFVSDPNDLQQMIASELVSQTQDMLDDLLELRKRKGMTQQDIAETIVWSACLPPHVNINRIEVMPTSQAFGPLPVHRR